MLVNMVSYTAINDYLQCMIKKKTRYNHLMIQNTAFIGYFSNTLNTIGHFSKLPTSKD